MRTIYPSPSIVTGTTARRVARVLLAAGSWDVDMVLGVPGSVSTGTAIVRPVGGATFVTFAFGGTPTRQPAQRITLAVATEIEVVVSNSSASVGSVMINDIRIAMAPLQLWANGVSVGIAAGIADVATSIVLAAGGGSVIGVSPTGGQYLVATIRNGTEFEVVRVTARSGDTLTVTRAQEGTAAREWPTSGTTVILAETADTLSRIQSGL